MLLSLSLRPCILNVMDVNSGMLVAIDLVMTVANCGFHDAVKIRKKGFNPIQSKIDKLDDATGGILNFW